LNWRRIQDISLKWKLIIPFLFLAAMGAAALFVVSYRFQASLIQVNEDTRLRNLYQVFLNDIESRKNAALSLAYLAAKNPEVAEALDRRDRNRLITLLYPAYQILERDFGVRQFHFHLPPATSFLRFHALGQFGEKMEAFRPTINQARETGIGVGGIERGVLGLSIRSVAPIFHQGRQIGTVEFGLSLEKPLLDEFKKNYGSDVVLYIQEKPEQDGPKVFASTLDQTLLPTNLFNRLLASGEVVFQPELMGSRKVASIIGPVRDFSAKTIGVVKISIDRSPTVALLHRYAALAAVLGLLGLAASISFVWFIAVVFTRRIGEVVKGADEIASGRRETRLPVKSGDDLGIMARAINQMLASLETSQTRLQEYAQNLESMVEQRTRSLKESEKTYRTLVENVPLIVYMIKPDGTTAFLNRSVEQIIGATPEQLNGPYEIWAGYIHPEDRDRVVALRDAGLKEKRELHTEYRMVQRGGALVHVFEHAVPVYNEEQNFIRMDGIVVDVTVNKELQEKILQAQELETLGQISARLAHEVRNPLTSIGGLARRLVKSFEPSDPRTEKGRLIVEQVQKLEKILKTMLAYIESPSIRLQPGDLNQVVTRAIDGLRTKLKPSAFSVKTTLDQSLDPIKLDLDLLEQTLAHLMEHAWQQMGGKGELEVGTRKNGAQATVTLGYPAPKLSEEDLEHFFYPFALDAPPEKGEPVSDRVDVSLAKIVINQHGGFINVIKENDQRIKITISLPGAA
jgi:PAS domain S-box-containing protein